MEVRSLAGALLVGALAGSGCGGPPDMPVAPEPVRLRVSAPADSVLAVARRVVLRADWQLADGDVAPGTLVAERTAPFDNNREWIRCPEGYRWGGPGLPRSTVRLQVSATERDGQTAVGIEMRSASAVVFDPIWRDMTRIRCVSSGRMERMVAEALAERFP